MNTFFSYYGYLAHTMSNCTLPTSVNVLSLLMRSLCKDSVSILPAGIPAEDRELTRFLWAGRSRASEFELCFLHS